MKPKIWLVTDTHFGHRNLIKYGRPEDFEQKIVKGLNECVKPEDTLIHLGDYELGNPIYMGNWGCSRVLIRGNHDSKSDSFYIKQGFTSVCSAMMLQKYGKLIYLTHIPRKLWDGVDLCIFGHFHGASHRLDELEGFQGGKYYELALENTNYQPMTLESIISLNY